MPITRKELIKENYLILRKALKEFVSDSFLPSLEEFEIIDVIRFLNLFFPKGKEDEYKHTIYIFVSEKEIRISDDDLQIVYNLILDFVNFLNNI
jgi:hypothetical protein